MQESTIISHPPSEAALALESSARRAERWFGEPFLHPGEDAEVALAPGTARRRALDDATLEIEAGLKTPSSGWKVRYGLMLGLERVLAAENPTTAAGTALRRHQIDALAGMLTELIAATQRSAEENGNGSGNGAVAELVEEAEDEDDDDVDLEDEETEDPTFVGEDPGASRRYRFRHPTASGKTIAAAGFVEAARELGVLILTHRRLLVDQFRRDLTTEGYGDRLVDAIERGRRAAPAGPDDDPDVRLVRAARRRALAHRVPARDLRRGPHGARREDVERDPALPRAALHRHDGDGAADREAGLGRLPGLGRRPPADRRRAARPDRAPPLPPRAPGRGDQLGADRRRRLRGARPRRRTRPRGAQPGGREPVPRPLRVDSRDRLRRGRRPRVQPRAGVPRRRPQDDGRLRPDTAARARRDARGVRARRDQRPDQRPAARRGLELTARDRLHAPRADGVEARLPAADRPDHADAPAQGGGHRRRLRAEGRDPQRARRLAALAARLGLLPRGRARHPRPAPALGAPGASAPVTGAVARPGHPGRRPPPRRHPARVAAGRPALSSTTTSSGSGRRSRDARSGSTSAPSSPASSRKDGPARARSRPSSPSARPRTRTGGYA